MTRHFAVFGPSHIAVLIVTGALPIALAFLGHHLRNRKIDHAISFGLAGGLVGTWAVWYWLIVTRGWTSLQTILPMDLCDWATIAAIGALVTQNQRAYELAYFWSLSGTLQALITPELFYDFPDLRFIIFFAFHAGTVAAVLYLTLARRMRPYPFSLPRVIIWSLLYLATALAVNRAFGTNFGYLRAKPARPSLLDVLGPWPTYVFELAGLGAFYVLVLYVPFFVADRLRHRRA